MDSLPLDVISRILHIGTAIVLVGGSVFLRFVLMPAGEALPEAEHDKLKAGVLGRWKRIVMVGIAVLLLTGFYNYLLGPSHPKTVGGLPYHALLGTKILLALVLFFLASALVGRSAALQRFRDRSGTTLAWMIVLAALIVAISGFAKVAAVAAG